MSDVPACTCDFTWEEMDAATSPWHRRGCPQGQPTPPAPKDDWETRFRLWLLRKGLGLLERADHLWPK